MRTLAIHQAGSTAPLVLTSEGNEVAEIYRRIKAEMQSDYEFLEFVHGYGTYLLNLTQVSRVVLT